MGYLLVPCFLLWLILSHLGADLHSYLENVLRSGKDSSDSEAEDFEHAEKLRHVKAVLEEVNCFFPSASVFVFLYDPI